MVRAKRATRPPRVRKAETTVEGSWSSGLGARHADVGQAGAERFVVLADPEGNDFCVLNRAPDRP
jgi:hypothetical protein